MLRIALTQRENVNIHGSKIDTLEHTYTEYLQQKGAFVYPIPNKLANPDKWLKDLKPDRIMLTGGGDIETKLFGGSENNKIIYQRDRDQLELKLLNYAIHNKIPTLGICRGAQMINIFFGGSLIQNIQKSVPEALNHINGEHSIFIKDKYQKIFQIKQMAVNSYHQSGFDMHSLGKNLESVAQTSDGIIECFFHIIYPIQAIMWHPERNKKIGNDPIINYFLNTL